jgi:hypothetical protein
VRVSFGCRSSSALNITAHTCNVFICVYGARACMCTLTITSAFQSCMAKRYGTSLAAVGVLRSLGYGRSTLLLRQPLMYSLTMQHHSMHWLHVPSSGNARCLAPSGVMQ